MTNEQVQESSRVLRDLVEAAHPVLAAHRSEATKVTGEQITTAWAAYDAARAYLRNREAQ